MSLKLITLNIERAKHLDLVVPFLQKEQPDVACLQEVREPDIQKLMDAMGAREYVFAPANRHPSEGEPAVIGICIISRLPMQRHRVDFYVGSPDTVPDSVEFKHDWREWTNELITATTNCALIRTDIEKDGTNYSVATTHFLWSEQGKLSPQQTHYMPKLLKLLEAKEDFVLTGDFNAPRGGELFGMLAAKYKDNVPPEYKTSIDLQKHRAATLGKAQELSDKMVDGIFSTPQYNVCDVRMICGVSDHCALVAQVIRA